MNTPRPLFHVGVLALTAPLAIGTPLGVLHALAASPGAKQPDPAPSAAYLVVTSTGGVVPFGDAANFGSLTEPAPAPGGTTQSSGVSAGISTETSTDVATDVATDVPTGGPTGGPTGVPTGGSGDPVVGAAATPDSGGYWIVTSAGQVSSFGDAGNEGSVPAGTAGAPVVGMAPSGDGKGYWLATDSGGVLTFGDAPFFGSAGDLSPSLDPGGSNAVQLAEPVVAITATPGGGGYWLVGSDGGVLTFGDALYKGSPYQLDPSKAAGGTNSVAPLADPIVGFASTPDGKGYWEVASDGGVFTFGDAGYFGSTGGTKLASPIVGMSPTADGKGYRLLASDGGVFTFGDAPFSGSAAGRLAAHESASVIMDVQSQAKGGSAAAQIAVAFALSQVGVPYLYGGTGDGGYDCSGLVMVAYEHAGISLPRTAQEQYDATEPVSAGLPLLPGDLVFFGASTSEVTHVGIYVGGGDMVHAPHTGTVVTVEPYDWSDYLGATRPAP